MATSTIQRTEKGTVQHWGTTAQVTRKDGHFLVLINGNFLVSVWFASTTLIQILGIHGDSGNVYSKNGENTITCGQSAESTEVTLTRNGETLTVTTTTAATISIFIL